MIKRIILITIFLLSISVSVYSVGESGGVLLLVDKINAEISSRGNVCGAWKSGSDTFLGNPGLASYVKNNSASVTYQKWIADTKLFAGSMSLNLFAGRVSIGGAFFDSGSITYFDLTGSSSVEIKATSLLIGVGYSKVVKNIGVGANLKILDDSYNNISSSSFMMDIGFAFNKITVPAIGNKANINNNLTIGASMLNLGTSLKGINDTSSLPTKIRFGVKYNFMKDYLNSQLDASLGIDNDYTITDNENDIKVGLSISGFKNLIVINTGYIISNSDAESLTLGTGINYSLNSKTIKLNFDYGLTGNFASLYAVSLGYNW